MGDRLSISSDIGPAVPILAIGRFAAHVLPPLHPALTDAIEPIFHHLCHKDVGEYSLNKKGWMAFLNAGFQETAPHPTEIRAFECLVAVAAAIERAVAAVVYNPPAPTMEFRNTPDTAPVSDWRGHDHRPDGYFLLRERPQHDTSVSESHWMFVGPTGEYSSERLIGDTASKIVWNMYQTLRDDPQRRFAFAFSIEQTEMQLWFANRGEVLVSEKFDFMSERQYLIHFFLAFLYAMPDAAGWDPTLTYIPGSDPLQYHVTVNDTAGNRHVYKTVKLESSIGAGVLCGRGTRVWRAVRCDAKTLEELGEEVVLKDCWMDQSISTEGDVIKTLDDLATGRIVALKTQLGDLQGTLTAAAVDSLEQELDAVESLKASLLTPIIHGTVVFPGSDGFDTTLDRDVVLRDADGNSVLWAYVLKTTSSTEADDDHRMALALLGGGPRRYFPRQRDPLLHDARNHYRIVYREVCTPLYQVDRLDSILLHLSEVTRALRGLHEVGWVHRDISPGNILITALGQVKLSDWEYAKQFDAAGAATRDARAGTKEFMAVEVDQREYLFIPHRDIKLNPSRADRSPIPPWSYNPLHDVESIWWLTKFFVENKDVVFRSEDKILDNTSLATLGIPHDASEAARRRRLGAQRNCVEGLFHHTHERFIELKVNKCTEAIWPLHPALLQHGLDRDIEKLRRFLVHFYDKVEAGFVDKPPKPFAFNARLYSRFRSELDKMAASVKSIPAHVHVVSLADAVAQFQPGY